MDVERNIKVGLEGLRKQCRSFEKNTRRKESIRNDKDKEKEKKLDRSYTDARRDSSQKDMIERTVDGKRKKEKKRIQVLDNLTKKNRYVYLNGLAGDRKKWGKL